MQLEGKFALVTGAGSGIGRALAVEGSQRGLTLALCGRRADALAGTLALLDASKPHIVIPADITHAEDRAAIALRLKEAWGRLDLLVNNAGVVTGGALEKETDAAIEQVVATNVTAPIALTRDLVPLLLAASPRASSTSARCSATFPFRCLPPIPRRNSPCVAFRRRCAASIGIAESA